MAVRRIVSGVRAHQLTSCAPTAWSAPSAIGLGGFGFGGQLGAEVTDFLIVLNVSHAAAGLQTRLTRTYTVPDRRADVHGSWIDDAWWKPLGKDIVSGW